jgi:GDP-4-dehydro-6-deoxy-D-mannose reductase
VALSEDCALQPSTSYGRVKLAQTLLTSSLPSRLGLSACVARTFNLVGPALPTRLVVGRLCDEFSRLRDASEEITIRHLESTRDFVDVRDAVAAYWTLVQHGTSGEVYNVCSGIPVSLAHVVELLSTATGKHPAVHTTEPRRESVDPDIVYGSFGKLKKATNWSPKIGLAESIDDMLAYIAANERADRHSLGR